MLDTSLDILFGVSVGDAVGVPAEFKSRQELLKNPIHGMTGHGSHDQPTGTFSDDSSLTFCLAEALTTGFNLRRVAENFINWRYDGYWTANGKVFDIGITTNNAIGRLVKGIQPDLAGDFEEYSNGNGSLMRILPLLLHIKGKPVAERYLAAKEVSSMTHAHIRSTIACFYYLEFALNLLGGKDKFEIYSELRHTISSFLDSKGINPVEKHKFNKLLIDQIHLIPEYQISSSGYVVHTLEASIWCLLNTDSYKDAILKAINLGGDTDTIGAVTGGLAGLLYGHQNIPKDWLTQLARKDDIEDLAFRLSKYFEV